MNPSRVAEVTERNENGPLKRELKTETLVLSSRFSGPVTEIRSATNYLIALLLSAIRHPTLVH